MPHENTRDCLAKAKLLLSDASIDQLRYAALQLRMGIEYLFYELRYLHREELPDDLVSKWQPKQVIDAILECDPLADQDGSLTLLIPDESGNPSAVGMTFETRAPNKRLLRKHYHRLGAYLHAPTDLVDPDLQKFESDLAKVVEELEVFDQLLATSNIAEYVTNTCLCGRSIKRNKRGVEENGEMRCPDPQCNALYEVTLNGNTSHFKLKEEKYDCPKCQSTNYFSAGKLKPGLQLTCGKCETQVRLISALAIQRLDDEPVAGGGGAPS